MSDIDSLLLRQMKKAGHVDPLAPPSAEAWQNFLSRVSSHYQHMRDDREMLVRSLDLSTQEMESGLSRPGEDPSVVSDLIGSFGATLDALTLASAETTSEGLKGEPLRSRLENTEALLLNQLDQAARSVGVQPSEVSRVGRSLSSVGDKLREAAGERSARKSLEEELDAARSVQELLTPGQTEISRPFLQFAAHSSPVSACTGDWWTAHDLPDGRFLVVIGDVTGHGMPAAIITGAAKASCDIARGLYESKLTAAALLRIMNRGIEGAGGQRLFMTCTVAVFNPHDAQLTIANAGQPLPYLVRPGGEQTQVAQLRAHGTPLGTNRSATYNAITVKLKEGDTIFLYTDGVLEREGPGGDMYGPKRLRLALEQGGSFDPRGLRDVVLHSLGRHSEGSPKTDDLTFLVCRYGDQ